MNLTQQLIPEAIVGDSITLERESLDAADIEIKIARREPDPIMSRISVDDIG